MKQSAYCTPELVHGQMVPSPANKSNTFFEQHIESIFNSVCHYDHF